MQVQSRSADGEVFVTMMKILEYIYTYNTHVESVGRSPPPCVVSVITYYNILYIIYYYYTSNIIICNPRMSFYSVIIWQLLSNLARHIIIIYIYFILRSNNMQSHTVVWFRNRYGRWPNKTSRAFNVIFMLRHTIHIKVIPLSSSCVF